MLVLGLNAYHADAAAALIRDGAIIAAAEEERFKRVKHWAGLPVESATWCLSTARASLSDVDVVALNRDPRANLGRKILYALRRRPSAQFVWDRIRNLRSIESIVGSLETALRHGGRGRTQSFHGKIINVEHHLAHQASSFLASPFQEAALLSVDGFGDFTSTSWGRGVGARIYLDGRIYFPHSLGAFYLAMTQFLGFTQFGDEYRVMGLAPYGKPRFLDAMRRVVRTQSDGTFQLDLRYFRHGITGPMFRWSDGKPSLACHFTPEIEDLVGPARTPHEELSERHKDIACSVQSRFEECLFGLVSLARSACSGECLCLSGGAAMNAVANGRILRKTSFRKIYVPPAPGDAGGAIGAALWAWQQQGDAGVRPAPVRRSYFGPRFNHAETERSLDSARKVLQARGCGVRLAHDTKTLCETVAHEVAAGRVVGWFQGRMEFGPRALGNRSIIGDPRREDMRDIINARIKLREPFRPFAPSVLREYMRDWFDVDDDVPFMMKAHPIRKDRRHLVRAVTHVDGTARPQTIGREQNPLYHRLVSAFYSRTGIPMVLNTSFNENEPIVRSPEEAIDCFLRTEMDVLVLGLYMLRKAG